MTLTGHTPGVRVPTQIATAVLPVQSVGSAPEVRFFQARPKLRRLVYVVGYEGLSVLFTVVVLSALLGHGGGESTLAAILVSTTATLWNYVWNTLYEAFERRRRATGRGARDRAIHAIGYEGGVLIFTIPLVAILLGVSLLEALAIEAGLLVFFLVFTLAYTWVFDRIFGLPASAV